MNGIIYVLEFPNGKKYIGQTVKDFNSRMTKHKSSASNIDKKDGCRALNNAIRKHGWDNITKKILEKCEIENLDEKEKEYISKFNTISPNGYNLMTGGNSNKSMSEETKLKMKNSALKRNSKKYRKKDETKDFPKYLGIYQNYPRITKHPNCSCKSFNDKNKSFEENLKDAKEFLEKLNNNEITVVHKKLPEGIQKISNIGFRVCYLDSLNNKKYKRFCNKKFTLDELLEQAKQYLASL